MHMYFKLYKGIVASSASTVARDTLEDIARKTTARNGLSRFQKFDSATFHLLMEVQCKDCPPPLGSLFSGGGEDLFL